MRHAGAVFLIAAIGVLLRAQQAPAPTSAQQRPVFRGGTTFIRVDAYPSKDGTIVQGLTAGDFQVLEDGAPQTIESFDYVSYPTWTPDAERIEPDSQRAGFDLAADPRYRVFVLFVDLAFSSEPGPISANNNLPAIQQPLIDFLDRTIGPQDLFGFLTSKNTAKDLVLAARTTVTEAQIKDLFLASIGEHDNPNAIDNCDCRDFRVTGDSQCGSMMDTIKQRRRADATYTALEGLVRLLGSLRQERKNIILISNQLPRWRPNSAMFKRGEGGLPPIVVGAAGIRTRVPTGGAEASHSCMADGQLLAAMDFDERYRNLIAAAQQQNVGFYVVSPSGLQAPPGAAPGQAADAAIRAEQNAAGDLRTLATDTDGLAILNTNDLSGGLRRIGDDLSAFYLLGYYTANTNWDGKVRTITVRLKSTGEPIRARREYRAPTADEIAALASGGAPKPDSAAGDTAARASALAALDRSAGLFAIYAAQAGPTLTVVTELTPQGLQGGRWTDAADLEATVADADGDPIATTSGRISAAAPAAVMTIPVSKPPARVTVRVHDARGSATDWVKVEPRSGTLLGDPVAYRSSSRAGARAVADFAFGRNERVRIEWPVLGPIDSRAARLLDRNGHAIPVELPLDETPDHKTLAMEMGLSGFGAGDYVIELTATGNGATDRRLLAIRVK